MGGRLLAVSVGGLVLLLALAYWHGFRQGLEFGFGFGFGFGIGIRIGMGMGT